MEKADSEKGAIRIKDPIDKLLDDLESFFDKHARRLGILGSLEKETQHDWASVSRAVPREAQVKRYDRFFSSRRERVYQL